MSADREEVANEAPPDEAPPVEAPLLLQWAKIGGDYIVRKLIGRGGQSQIYEGYDTRNERVVAIKVFLFKHQLNAAMLKRAKAEAEAEMRLTHPNIVKVYAAGVSEIMTPDGKKKELFYSVMEFLEGETLEDRLYRTGKLAFAEALWILAEAADGLAMLHFRKIIHRDVKPENIFLAAGTEGRPRVVLIDLGIAKLDPKEFSVQRTDANILMGTFAYMSPEQIHHKFPVDGRTDLYALGLVAFKCFTSVHPAWNHFEQPNPPLAEEYAAWHMAAVPPKVSALRVDAPASVDALVAAMCAKVPDERPVDAIEAAKVMRAILAEVEAAPAPVVPVAPPGRRAPPGPVSPSERWRPLGQATTQEDETTAGPTNAGVVPVRLREMPAPAPTAPLPAEVSIATSAVRGASSEPPLSSEPSSSWPPPRPPMKTSAGTEIIEVSSVRPLQEAPRSVPPPGAAVERTRTGTVIVPREKMPSIALDSTPLDLGIVASPRAADEAVPARSTVEVDVRSAARPRTLPFGGAKREAHESNARDGRASSTGLLIAAALLGALTGLVTLRLWDASHAGAIHGGAASTEDAGAAPSPSVAPSLSAAVEPDPSPPAELPDAGSAQGDASSGEVPDAAPMASPSPVPAPSPKPAVPVRKPASGAPKPASTGLVGLPPLFEKKPEPAPTVPPGNRLPKNAAPIPIRATNRGNN
ncbi:MAG: protein kinase [Polyangiaceae bacterium]